MAFLSAERMLDAMDGVCYVLDRRGKLRSIGRKNWTAAADASGSSYIADPKTVIGKPLETFLAGDRVKEIHRRYMALLLAGEIDHVAFTYRCDAPQLRRESRMSMTAMADGRGVVGILCQSLTISETLRPPMNLFDLAAMMRAHAQLMAKPMITLCSYCADVAWPPGAADAARTWISAEDYYRRGGTEDVVVSHGVCPDCDERLTVRDLVG